MQNRAVHVRQSDGWLGGARPNGVRSAPVTWPSFCCGSARVLAHGGWLIQWSGLPFFGEYDRNGPLAFGVGLPSYRIEGVPFGRVAALRSSQAWSAMHRAEPVAAPGAHGGNGIQASYTAGVRTALGSMVAAGLVAATVAIGAAAQPGAVPERPTWWKDVRPIVQGRCIGCHRPNGIGPFSLTTYRSARAHRAAISYMVGKRLMPPWPAARGVRRYRYDWSLTDRQITIVRRWAARGGPLGDRRSARPALPSVGERKGLQRVDESFALPEPYTAKGVDDYRCFILPWTPEAPTFITGFEMRPGQPSQVHHAETYILGFSEAVGAAVADQQDPGPGYGCPASQMSPRAQYPIQLLGGWAPGGGDGGRTFPQGTGVSMKPGSFLMMQLHYHHHHGAYKPDLTRIALTLEPKAKPGAWLAVLDAQLLLSQERFRIPPGEKDVVYRFVGDPRDNLVLAPGDIDLTRGFVTHMVFLHMHQLGSYGRISFVRHGGGEDKLLRIRDWSFNWQIGYELEQPVVFEPGDQMLVECHWDNTAANQPLVNGVRAKPRLVTWGESSDNEMCGGYMFVSER